MKSSYENLGKVSLSADGFWDRSKSYERLCLVTDKSTNLSYISRKDVDGGVDITNTEYWQRVGSSGYKSNNIIILTDEDSGDNLVEYDICSAAGAVSSEDRRCGLVLGFFGTSGNWELYQFNSDNVSDWLDESCWTSVYGVNRFKGYFKNETALKYAYKSPSVGDYAFVGDTFVDSVVYYCLEDGNWSTCNEKSQSTMSYIKVVANDTYHIPANYTTSENVYEITMGDTAYEITYDSCIKWFDGEPPVTQASKTYLISVINNLAVWGEF